MLKRLFSIYFLLIFGCTLLNALTSFETAEKLYMNNKIKEALPLLEQVLADEPRNELAYIYLSNCYESLNEFQKSIDVLEKGLHVAHDYKYGMYYFMGNAYFVMAKYKLALDAFTQSIALKDSFDKAVLNRAESYLELGDYKPALADYIHYLELAPQSPQKKEVEEIIKILSQTLSDEEKAALDKEAKEKQLKDLIKSLEDAKDSSKNLSAGADKLKEDYTEGDLMN
jgi:tetratricopeptide (TPR) repeat protein